MDSVCSQKLLAFENHFNISHSDASRIYRSDYSTQEEIDQAIIDLRAAQEAVTKRDASDLITEMNEIICQALTK